MTSRQLLRQAKDEQIRAQCLLNAAERLLHVSFVARQLDVHPETVRAWIRSRKIDFVKLVPGGYRIPSTEYLRLIGTKTQNSQTVML